MVRRYVAWSILALVVSVDDRPLYAACNIIPSASRSFRGAVGTTDRPFAMPGDFITVRSPADVAGCPAVPLFSANKFDHVVTLVFTPPAGPRNVVVLTNDCGEITSCSGVTTTCVDLRGGDAGVVLRDGELRYMFRFPDTDDLVGASGDDRTLSGPVQIAIKDKRFAPSAQLAACELVDPTPQTCAALLGSLPEGINACIDDLFNIDGTCETTVGSVNRTFPAFTALPPPNDYQRLCLSPSPPCVGVVGDGAEARFSTDRAGNMLIPMDWHGILLEGSAVPVPRLLRAAGSLQAFGGNLVNIPNEEYLASYTPEGALLPPIFEPQVDEVSSNTVLFGSADAPVTVLRVTRRLPPYMECSGGSVPETPCTTASDCTGGGTCGASDCHECSAGSPVPGLECHRDADCAPGTCGTAVCGSDADCAAGIECGPALFDFDGRFSDGGVGPVVLPRDTDATCSVPEDEICAIGVQDSVPLEGFTGTDSMLALSVNERVSASVYNGDGDTSDSVLILRDRATGNVLKVAGNPNGIGDAMSEGRAVARISVPPFSYPAVEADGNLLAFLEPESQQETAPEDKNGNARVFDRILRIFRRENSTSVSEVGLELGVPRVADASPVINARSIAVSNGRVFYRHPETANAMQSTARVSVDVLAAETNAASGALSLSADGRFIAFESDAGLVAADTNGVQDVYVRDRDVDGDGIFDESGMVDVILASVDTGGTAADGPSGLPSISIDGRYVAFESSATDLVIGDGNGFQDIFVRDIFLGATVRVSVASNGTPAMTGASSAPSISAYGRVVAFQTLATDLAGSDGNAVSDVLIHDRDADDDGVYDETGVGERKTVRVSVTSDGSEATGGASRLAPAANSPSLQSVSWNGQYVAFVSGATNLDTACDTPPCDTNGGDDVFVHDRDADYDGIFDEAEAGSTATHRVSKASDGTQANGASLAPVSISFFGESIAFASHASNLIAGCGPAPAPSCDTNSTADIFVHDLFSGGTERINASSAGAQASGGPSTEPMISSDNRFVAYRSAATNLVSNDSNGQDDIFLYDRSANVVTRVNLGPAAAEADGESSSPAINSDGSLVGFRSAASNLVAGDGNTCPGFAVAGTCPDSFLRAPDPSDVAEDLTGDGDLMDTVLRVYEDGGGTFTTLCPASRVAVNFGMVAFLRSELEGDAASCPLLDGNGSLNDDLDGFDQVAHFWDGVSPTAVNLHCAGRAVALSSSYIAVLVPEDAQGNVDLNGDGDSADTVVMITDTAAPYPTACDTLSGWISIDPDGAGGRTGLAADAVAVSGDRVLVITPEYEQGVNLNGAPFTAFPNLDADTDDRVLGIFGVPGNTYVNVGLAARELVVNSTDALVAFSTLEAEQGGADLNGDTDANDAVLNVYNLLTSTVIDYSPKQAVRLCDFEECDPRKPYQVFADIVRFLTDECDQGDRPAAACADGRGSDLNDNDFIGDTVVQSLNVRTGDSVVSAAANGGLADDVDPLADDPLALEQNGGTEVFVSVGHCKEDTGVACDPLASADGCDNGAFCEAVGAAGHCMKDHGPCANDGDCPPSVACAYEPIVVASADEDGDDITDAIDNCPFAANADQTDTDADGEGDACDLQTCGNVPVPVREVDEECDAGDAPTCPGDCLGDCECACVGSPITDPSAVVVVKARREAGVLSAKFVVALGSYTDEVVRVRLDDGNSEPIAKEYVGPLSPSGAAWKFTRRGDGLKKVRFKDLGGGNFQVVIKARRWFGSAVADDSAANTRLTLTVGAQCFTHAATKKVDP